MPDHFQLLEANEKYTNQVLKHQAIIFVTET